MAKIPNTEWLFKSLIGKLTKNEDAPFASTTEDAQSIHQFDNGGAYTYTKGAEAAVQTSPGFRTGVLIDNATGNIIKE